MKAHRENKSRPYSSTFSITSELDRGGWLTPAPRSRPLYPWERDPVPRAWVYPKAGLDECGEYRAHQDSIPEPSTPSESLYRYAIPAHERL